MNNGNFGFEHPVEENQTGASAIDIQKEKHNFSRLGFGLALFSLVSLAAALVIKIIVDKVSPEFHNSTLFANMLSPMALYLFALPVLLLVIGSVKPERPEKKKMGFGTWLLILFVSFGLMYIGAYMGNIFMGIVSDFVGYDYSNALNSLIDYDTLWITAIFVVVIAPIGEELVFRKLIIDRTRKHGAFVSIFFSALVFGLMHGNFYQFFYAFAVGLVFGYVYYNTGKIYLSIGLHAALNFIGSILTAYISRGIERSEIFNNPEMTDAEMMQALISDALPMFAVFVFFSFVIAAMVCAIVIPIVLRKRIILQRGELGLTAKQTWTVVFANCGVIVMLAVYLLEFAISLIPG